LNSGPFVDRTLRMGRRQAPKCRAGPGARGSVSGHTSLRGAVAGATIGGANTLLTWPLGWWLWSDSELPGVEPMELFKTVMLYLPGNVIASGLVGMATVSGGKVPSPRAAKPRNT